MPGGCLWLFLRVIRLLVGCSRGDVPELKAVCGCVRVSAQHMGSRDTDVWVCACVLCKWTVCVVGKHTLGRKR